MLLFTGCCIWYGDFNLFYTFIVYGNGIVRNQKINGLCIENKTNLDLLRNFEDL